MKWHKFSEKRPSPEKSFLYHDSAEKRIIIAEQTFSRGFVSEGYYCNDPKCDWINDFCDCDLIIDLENDYWMELPDEPLKEKNE